MKEDKSKLQLIGEIAEANNKNLELIEEINKLSNKIDKAIELIENDYFEDGSGEYIEQVLSILRGEKDEK